MTRDMTKGSPLKSILLFCVPLLIGNLFQQFYNLADSILVGRILGLNAFAAVGSTGAMNFLILGFALGVCSGFAIPIAQSFGAGDEKAVRKRAAQLIWLGLGITALIMLIAWLWTDDLLRLTHTPEEIYDEAYCYIFIVFMGVGATMLYNLGSSVLRALGDSRSPLHFLIGAVIVNVFLDILLMKYLGFGVEGAAWATVLSQLAAGLACLIYMIRRVPMLRLRKNDLRPDRHRMALIAAVGVPMGLQFSITAIGTILVQGAVNELGAAAVAAVAAGVKVHNIVAAPLESCGIAMATYCGQNLGAGKLERIRRGMWGMVGVALLYCALAFTVNFLAGTTVARLFVSAAETAILLDVRRYLVIMSAFYPLLALIFLFRNGLQGMGFSRQAMGAGLAELAARALVTFLLVARLGFTAICLASPVAWFFADVLLLWLYHSEMKRLRVEPVLPRKIEQPRLLRAKGK